MLARRTASLLASYSKQCTGQRTPFSTTAAAQADFTHAVIGGGVVGLAIAHHLAQTHPSSSTVLIERHDAIGTETSSRNSEVIHAGIYYGAQSLKARLCIRGKELLYALAAERAIPHRRTGKWIVAQNAAQREILDRIYAVGKDELGVPMNWVSKARLESEGEGVRAEAGALESPTTGIVDSHGLMLCLLGLFEDAGGVLALNSPVLGVRAVNKGLDGWEVDVKDDMTGEESTISAETVVNSAGLAAADVHNMIIGTDEKQQQQQKQQKLYYAKGNYFSYSASKPSISRLIYPVPEPGAGGLGTHLTLDLGGRMRFGPDVEWVDTPENLAVNASRLEEAVREIKKYLPAVDEASLVPDYAGIRPKLAPKGATGFHDFVIRLEDGYTGWVNLLGIESPGLTSSLAIAEYVDGLLYGSGSSSGSGSGMPRDRT